MFISLLNIAIFVIGLSMDSILSIRGRTGLAVKRGNEDAKWKGQQRRRRDV